MSDVQEMRIFAAEQIVVPDDFPGILKNYAKDVVKGNPPPENIIQYSRQYFEALLAERGYFKDNAPVGDEQASREVPSVIIKNKV